MKLFYNGAIYPLHKEGVVFDSMLMDGDRILATGSREELKDLLKGSVETLDLNGAMVTPGLVDSHTHFLLHSLNLLGIDLGECQTLQDAVATVRLGFEEGKQQGGWIVGGGWDKNLWAEGWPNRSHLDAITGEIPIALRSKDYHSLWVNTAALQKAGITGDTPDPPGGAIARDSQGYPLGILKENACDLILDIIPDPSLETATEALKEGMLHAASLGLTGVHTFEGELTLRALQRLYREQELSLRFLLGIPRKHFSLAQRLGLETGLGDGYLRLGALKLFLDGALGSQTASMEEPYLGHEEYRGIPTMEGDVFFKQVQDAVDSGFSLAIHAIGDRAVRMALDGLEKVHEKSKKLGLRHRIEHAQLISEEDLDRIARLQVLPSMQPVHLKADRRIIEAYWGKERGSRAYPCQTLLDKGATLLLGSDAPVATIDPIIGLQEAMFRTDYARKEALSPYNALRAYTYGSAFGAGEENRRGLLKPGYQADCTVFSHDFIKDPDSIYATDVLFTICGGEITFDSRA